MKGRVISIVGAPGVGKSLLATQLASFISDPVFPEGEEGVLKEEILRQIFDESADPLEKYKSFFVPRYEEAYKKARSIADSGIDCFLDGEYISIVATMMSERVKDRNRLLEFAKEYEDLKADIVILIVANEECIKQNIERRGRFSEKNERMLQRSMNIQANFLKLARERENVFIVNRSDKDFKNSEDLEKMTEIINAIKARDVLKN